VRLKTVIIIIIIIKNVFINNILVIFKTGSRMLIC